MTYDPYEISEEASRPVELYTLGIGSKTWRYTSAEDEVSIDGETYEPISIERTSIMVSVERSDAVEVTVPALNEFAAMYIGVPPGVVASIEIQRYQREDTDEELKTEFLGIVQSLKFTNDFQNCALACYWNTAKTGRPIPRFRSGAQCNYRLGASDTCKVNLDVADFEFTGSVSAVNANIITVPGLSGTYANGWFNGGMVSIPTLGDYRLILSHAGNDLTLLLPFHEDVTGVLVEVQAGCDHRSGATGAGDCATKFDNVIEFGGYPWVPPKNPFETGIDP
jgi:uncharacterized phage protein (TIGR02218 family)